MKAIAFGEILWDIIDGKPHLGGAPLNFAAHLAKSGAESHMVSAVGKDDLGTKALKQVRDLGVGTEHVNQLRNYPTGTVDVFLEDGQPDYIIHEDVAFDHIKMSDKKLPDVDLFYFGTLIQRASTSRSTLYGLLEKNHFDYVFYDVNLRKNCYSAENIMNSLELANIVKLNLDEVDKIGRLVWGGVKGLEAFLTRLDDQYAPKIVIVTDGGNGCYIYELNELKHVAGIDVKVQDAVGAGDSFSAAFMAKYFKSKDALLSATVANKVGAFVASCEGAIPEYSDELIAELN